MSGSGELVEEETQVINDDDACVLETSAPERFRLFLILSGVALLLSAVLLVQALRGLDAILASPLEVGCTAVVLLGTTMAGLISNRRQQQDLQLLERRIQARQRQLWDQTQVMEETVKQREASITSKSKCLSRWQQTLNGREGKLKSQGNALQLSVLRSWVYCTFEVHWDFTAQHMHLPDYWLGLFHAHAPDSRREASCPLKSSKGSHQFAETTWEGDDARCCVTYEVRLMKGTECVQRSSNAVKLAVTTTPQSSGAWHDVGIGSPPTAPSLFMLGVRRCRMWVDPAVEWRVGECVEGEWVGLFKPTFKRLGWEGLNARLQGTFSCPRLKLNINGYVDEQYLAAVYRYYERLHTGSTRLHCLCVPEEKL